MSLETTSAGRTPVLVLESNRRAPESRSDGEASDVDRDPCAAADTTGQPRTQIEQPFLQAVLLPHRSLRAIDHRDVRDDTCGAVLPGSGQLSPRIAWRDARPR